ncbi:hypothetical protein AAMO2058_001492800 [Amorphochlora amoebiformis]
MAVDILTSVLCFVFLATMSGYYLLTEVCIDTTSDAAGESCAVKDVRFATQLESTYGPGRMDVVFTGSSRLMNRYGVDASCERYIMDTPHIDGSFISRPSCFTGGYNTSINSTHDSCDVQSTRGILYMSGNVTLRGSDYTIEVLNYGEAIPRYYQGQELDRFQGLHLLGHSVCGMVVGEVYPGSEVRTIAFSSQDWLCPRLNVTLPRTRVPCSNSTKCSHDPTKGDIGSASFEFNSSVSKEGEQQLLSYIKAMLVSSLCTDMPRFREFKYLRYNYFATERPGAPFVCTVCTRRGLAEAISLALPLVITFYGIFVKGMIFVHDSLYGEKDGSQEKYDAVTAKMTADTKTTLGRSSPVIPDGKETGEQHHYL